MNIAGDKLMAENMTATVQLADYAGANRPRNRIIWIGTDDGNLQVSRDGGETFTNVYNNAVAAGAPKGYVQTARIEPSHFDPATAYVALDNHRCCDDWKAYLFKTTDYGKTWSSVGNLPSHGTVNAARRLRQPEPAVRRH
jgi:photosystem II stability/assembly factor-like uncharacterized protein